MTKIQPPMTLVTDVHGRTVACDAPITAAPYVYPPLFGADYQPVADLTKRYPGARYTAVYGPRGMPSAAAINAVPASVTVVSVSFKGAPDPAAMKASLTAARRDGRLILVEGFHEFNRSRANGGPLAADYHRDMDVIVKTVRALDPSGDQLGTTQTYSGYAARHLTGDRAWKLFARDDVDVVGVDLEWDDKLGTAAYPTPEALQAIALDIRAYAGKPLAYREFAWRRLAYDTNGAILTHWYTEQAAFAVAQKVWAFSIYDTDGSTGKYRLLDGSPELAAVKKIIG
jgi:hypothetical protein